MKEAEVPVHYRKAGINTEVTGADLELLEKQLRRLKKTVQELQEETADLKEKQHFHLSSIAHNDSIVRFYTGFETLSALMVCFDSLGLAVNKLSYWASSSTSVHTTSKSNKGRKSTFSPLGDFFLVLVLLHL